MAVTFGFCGYVILFMQAEGCVFPVVAISFPTLAHANINYITQPYPMLMISYIDYYHLFI